MSPNEGILDKNRLLGFLEEVEKEIARKITLVAAGGTAMTLLGAKLSTLDVDFTLPGRDFDEFKKALDLTPHGFNVDIWNDGMVFSQFLPDDYLDKSISIKTKLTMIELRALDPVDIIVTKVGRLIDRDKADIASCIKKFNITESAIKQRGAQIEYVGREENYQINLNHVLKNFSKFQK